LGFGEDMNTMDIKHMRRVIETLFFYKYPYKG
jgi:hypothetical protein